MSMRRMVEIDIEEPILECNIHEYVENGGASLASTPTAI